MTMWNTRNIRIARAIGTGKFEPARAADLPEVIGAEIDRIKLRAQMGLDTNGRPLKRKKDGSPSTLRRTGQLLNGLQAEVEFHGDGVRATIRVMGPAAKYAQHVNAERQFMGISETARSEIKEKVRESLFRSLRQI